MNREISTGANPDVIIPADHEVRLIPWSPPGGFLRLFDLINLDEDRELQKAFLEVSQKAGEVFLRDLKVKGLLGIHELLSPLQMQRGLWGNIQGEWASDQFLFIKSGKGEIRGEVRTGSSIQFAWNPTKQDIVFTELPTDRITFRVDPERKVPGVFFSFYWNKFVRHSKRAETVLFGKSTRYLEVDTFSHVSDYLTPQRAQALLLVPQQYAGILPIGLKEASEIPSQVI